MEKDQFTIDNQFMRRAIQLAYLAGVNAAPNPMVGAVIVHNDIIIGEGFHEKCGSAHAEVKAIASVEDQDLLAESTIYVSLEPCAHFGKTPPCADLLVSKKFKRVVIATSDPFSKVAGKGLEILKKAGIPYSLGVAEKEAIELNKRFFTFHTKKRPYIILKWAQSQDGFVAPAQHTGVHWITSPETQVITHQWRTQEMAILVGKNTVISDNPSLDARAYKGPNPIRIVLDSHLQVDENSTLFSDGKKTMLFAKHSEESQSNASRFKMNEQVELYFLNNLSPNTIVSKLYDLQITSLIVEGGSQVLQSFIDSNFWDEARILTGCNQLHDGKPAPIISGNRVFNEKINKHDNLEIMINRTN
jgi:diaminohydroxyphosphoribosylaminopyrimidine deaminase / 5-amino-6-(5-phosphoribosylamino)uracil reductase